MPQVGKIALPLGERSSANQRGGGGVDAVSTGGAVGNDGVVRRGDKLLAGVGKERWRRRGSCWRYLLPSRRRGCCLPGCVSWVVRSSSGGSRCSAAPGLRALGRFGAATDGNIRAPCMIRGARAAKGAHSWQDLRAVYSQTAVCRAFRIHGAHILPKPAHFRCMARESCRELAIFPSETTFGMHGAQNLPRIAARERTVVKSCHGKALGDASRESIAAASQAKSASVRSPATVGRWETHFASILPSSSARERTARVYCHYQSPESAFAKILPWTNAWIRPTPNNCRPPRKKNGTEGRTWRTPPPEHERQSAGAAGASSRYGAVQRHRRTLGNAARRNIAMADNAPRDKRRRAFCSPSFAVLFTARVAIGAFAVGSRRHLAASLIEAHIW